VIGGSQHAATADKRDPTLTAFASAEVMMCLSLTQARTKNPSHTSVQVLIHTPQRVVKPSRTDV
jgi:hypothetical protein